jgi:cell division protease FtsH
MKMKKKRTPQSPFSPNTLKNLALAALFVVGVLYLYHTIETSRNIETVSYSKYLSLVEQNKVKKVHVIGADVQGVLEDGTRFETIVGNNPKNWELLAQHNVEVSVDNPANQLNYWYFLPLFILLLAGLAIGWFLLRQMRGSGGNGGGGPGNIFSFGKSRAQMILPSQVKETFESIAGADEAKEELREVVDFLRNPEKYKRFGAKVPKGILLIGEPGNGKTLLARTVAGEANVPFFSISGSDFIEVFVGVGAARVRDLFEQAERQAPCIIFIDELDAIGRARGIGMGGGHDEREQTLNQLLIKMDGFAQSNAPIVVIAATNRPDVLDKALLRPGRFDTQILVPYPDQKAREAILRIHAEGKKFDPAVDLSDIAANTAGLSGADLADLINKAAIMASKKGHEVILPEDVKEAHERVLKSKQSGMEGGSGGSINENSSANIFMPTMVDEKFDSVAGMPEVKEEIMDIIDFLKNPEKYAKIGARIPRGILLEGDPGNGKTLLARAMAGEAQCPFISTNGSDFVQKYVGEGAARIRELFATARRRTPAIIFIDEIDSIGMKRSNEDGGSQEFAHALNQLLTEMDGFQKTKAPIIVIGSTNRADRLDSALTRPGRFDRKVHVPYPTLSDREAILQVHTKKIKLEPDVDLHKIARGTPGFSGAALANLMNEAAIIATKREQEAVTVADIEEARDKIIIGKHRPSMQQTKKELEMTAYHEAGHVLVRVLMPEVTDPLHKVTILPRGGALGVTHSLPERDKYTENREEMIALIMVCAGGRAAEELVYNTVTTGASNDFEKATYYANKMVCNYGMSSLGPVVCDRNKVHVSPETAHKIDNEVRNIVDTCYADTIKLLRDNRDKLDIIARALIEKETLQSSEIYELLGVEPRMEHKLS